MIRKKDYTEISKTIFEAVGGIENISSFAHCMTRVRFNLKDQSLVNEELLKNKPEIIGGNGLVINIKSSLEQKWNLFMKNYVK